MNIPTNVANTHNTIFSEILDSAFTKRLSCSIHTVSMENVENVVNAPSNPVITKAFCCGAIVCSKYNTKKPIMKLPSTFTTNVPYGNVVPKIFCTHPESKSLLTAPKNPPIPTAKIICQPTIMLYSSNTTMS